MFKQSKTLFLTHFEGILKTLGLISIVYSMWASQYQIGQSRESEEKNLDWQRKTLTQDKIDARSTSQLTNDIKRRRKVLQDSLPWIYSDSSLRANVRTRLNYYESLCRGIKIGIYDESVVSNHNNFIPQLLGQ